MAAVTQIASGAWVADAATVWDGGAVPAIGDDVDATGNFDLTVDDDTNAVGSFDRSGSTGDLVIDNAKTLDVDGACTLDGPVKGPGTIAVSGNLALAAATAFTLSPQILLDGTGNLTDNSAAPGGSDIEVNTAGTHTAATAIAADSFTLAAGTYVDGGYDHDVYGAILIVGTLTSTGRWTQEASGDVRGGVFNAFAVAAGATPNLKAVLQMRKFIHDGDDVATDAASYMTVYPAAADWWTQSPASKVSVKVVVQNASAPPGNDIVLNDADLDFQATAASKTVAMDANIDTGGGDLYVRGTGAQPARMIIDMAGYSLDTGGGKLTLGFTNTGDGQVLLGEGSHRVGDVAAGHANNDTNSLALEWCYLECSGTLDADNIAVSADADDLVHIVCTGTGEITNFDPAQVVHCHGDASVDGGGNNGANNKTTFNAHAPPGSLAMMGAGV